MSGPQFGWLWLIANPILLAACFVLLRALFVRKPEVRSSWAEQLVGIMDGFSQGLLHLVKWFALAMVLITVALVLGRYVFGVGSLKGQETVIYLHALLFLLASGATLLRNGHVRVDIFYSGLSARNKAVVDFAGTLLFLVPVCLLILVYSQSYVALAWKFHEGSAEADGLPWVYLLKTAIPAFAILMLLQGSAQALRAALQLVGQPMPAIQSDKEML
ncbi:TRAP dicarboxylate transporter, DctQ subunit, unknown substrate 6 [hydrothermal vent metagenome]|uniref:Tripartite ATP-independent periplasmic transporters DctQ component domain-containing protein n=1 Tax=hydrothermal vent metagenome TaxID=652676 RepID=A0A3B0SB13_9ZZZZ